MRYLKQHWWLLIIIIPAWILTLLPLIFDGQYGCVNGTCGFIVGTNYRDGIWFQAVAATAFKTFPFQMPNYAGEVLRGYHYIPNLLSYILSYVGIPIAFTFYKILPIFFMGALTYLAIRLARLIKDSPVFVGIFLFTTYFGMHLSLFTSLYHFGEIRNSVLINTFQATRLLESPHAALAMLLLYSVLIILHKENQTTKDSILIAVMIFLATGTKFYVAFSIASIVGLYECIRFFKSRKHIGKYIKKLILYSVGGLTGILLFYDPLNAHASGSIFIFSPFATVHHLIESPDLFYNESMINARYFLYEQGWSPRLLFIEMYSAALFIIFYFGTRIIGAFQILKELFTRKLSPLTASISISIGISSLIAVLFIQKGDWFNPIQFAVPAAFLINIFVAKLLYELLEKNQRLGATTLAVFVLLTFPANFANAGYLSNPGRLVIPEAEMEALRVLKAQPDGVVFAPMDENDMAYVSAMTGKPTYLNFVNTLENAGIDFEGRLLLTTNPEQLIEDKMIDYFYLPYESKKQENVIKVCESPLFEKVYENVGVVVCKRKS